MKAVFFCLLLGLLTSAIGQDLGEKVTSTTVLENPEAYDGLFITVVGVHDISHFEDVNVGGIQMDWACYDSEISNSAEASWQRLAYWRDSALDNSLVEVKGTFLIDIEGRYSRIPGTKIDPETGLCEKGF